MDYLLSFPEGRLQSKQRFLVFFLYIYYKGAHGKPLHRKGLSLWHRLRWEAGCFKVTEKDTMIN